MGAAKRLGFGDLRPQQMEAIRTFMQVGDVFVSLPTLCKKGCYAVLYNACIRVLCTRYTRVIRMCITLRMDTLGYSIHSCV